jgi:Uma2 family endonuclease
MAIATMLETPVRAQPSPIESADVPFVEEPLYEVVGGKKVELPPMAVSSNRVAWLVSTHLGTFAVSKGHGWVYMEALHWLDEPGDVKRRPDVSFVSYDRWPRDKPIPDDEAWQVIPELAVEVVSPSDKADDLLEKVEEYFAAGVVQVWVVYPRRRVAHVFESFTSIRVVSTGQDLEGGALLPGFRLPLATLFEDLGPPPGAATAVTT